MARSNSPGHTLFENWQVEDACFLWFPKDLHTYRSGFLLNSIIINANARNKICGITL